VRRRSRHLHGGSSRAVIYRDRGMQPTMRRCSARLVIPPRSTSHCRTATPGRAP